MAPLKKALKRNFLPNLAIDCVIFGYHEKRLKILCTRFNWMPGWLLPGGYVMETEDIDKAAARILEERTGVKDLYLKQFKTFGKMDRGRRSIMNIAQFKDFPGTNPKQKWIAERFISIGYYALTEYSKVIPGTDIPNMECSWIDIRNMKPFLLDHEEIFRDAFKSIQFGIHHEPVGLNLLPEKFTLPELQALYETILEKKLDQRNFTKKLIMLDLIRKQNEKRNIGGHRSPALYKFNKIAYRQALKQGIELAF